MLSSFLLSLFAVFCAGIAQIVLKKTAGKYMNAGIVRKFLNFGVVSGYMLMLLSSLMNVVALKQMPLNLTPISEATGYLWVPLLSWLFLQTKPTKRNMAGAIVIVLGMLVFALGYT